MLVCMLWALMAASDHSDHSQLTQQTAETGVSFRNVSSSCTHHGLALTWAVLCPETRSVLHAGYTWSQACADVQHILMKTKKL